jgi:hypothetical protein
MKKLIMIALVLITTIGYAQDQKEKMKKDWTPEQMAEKKTKKMTSELNLTDAQQERVRVIHLNKANEGKSRRTEMRANNETARSNYKAQMKTILSADQYSKWLDNKGKSESDKRSKHQQKRKQ